MNQLVPPNATNLPTLVVAAGERAQTRESQLPRDRHTAYLKNGGTLEKTASMTPASMRTTTAGAMR